ncbi:peptide ABC transporter permease [Evansella sp. AB-rgal1]|uniref:peptide ABC transporter permease n=1 Tax=Evansella sp. AB-rgal1 TaxID=3242696 RepID=UPI00359DA5DE
MENYIPSIYDELSKKLLSQYWPNFNMIPFAIYDKKQVYIFHHPRFSKAGGYDVLPWSDSFIGDTLIIFEEQPTAIVNLELHVGYERVYSMLVHELFHGLQHLEKERRFPNEMLGIFYPFSLENVEIRNKERQCLYNALMCLEQEDKRQNLQQFVLLREARAELIGEHFSYETAIETIEGPAWYVEMKAYFHKSRQSYKDVLESYSSPLLDRWDSTSNIRKSCYSSGLLLCILLDELSPNWKRDFFHSEKTLYELLKQCVDINSNHREDIEISKDTELLVQKIVNTREEVFVEYEKQEGYHVFLEGSIKVKGFDPMNITSSLTEKKLLHRRTLTVEIEKKTYVFQQPVVAHYRQEYRNIYRLHLVSKGKPMEEKDGVNIDGVGKIEGCDWTVLFKP